MAEKKFLGRRLLWDVKIRLKPTSPAVVYAAMYPMTAPNTEKPASIRPTDTVSLTNAAATLITADLLISPSPWNPPAVTFNKAIPTTEADATGMKFASSGLFRRTSAMSPESGIEAREAVSASRSWKSEVEYTNETASSL